MKLFPCYTLLLIFFISGINNKIQAQFCAGGTATETLDANNANIMLSSSGIWAYEFGGVDDQPAYGWPHRENSNEEGSGLIFTGNLWMGGFDSGNNLKIAQKTYGQDDRSGYWPGPLNSDGSITTEACANWDRLFKVTKTEIESFLADFLDNQQIDNPIPPSILGWPAKNSLTFFDQHGFQLPNGEASLAPYFDLNEDGIYNPFEGDYPLTKFADEAVWWVFNDVGNIGNFSYNPLRMEVQMMAYVYDSEISNIQNSSFYDVKLINKGSDLLESFFVAIWMDPDLGCPYDDFLGCVPEENIGFVYNADSVDGIEDGTCDDFITYEEVPMFGIKLLEGPFNADFSDRLDMSSFTFYKNFDPIPFYPSNYYRMITGTRYDGASFLDPDNQPTKFLHPDNPADTPDGWSMCSEDAEMADRRILMSMGPMRLNPLQENSMTFAFVVQSESNLPCPDIDTFIMNADLPIPTNIPGSFYDDLIVATTGQDLLKTNLSVFPNPTTDQLNFRLSENESFLSIHIYRMDGKLIRKEENIRSTKISLEQNDLTSGTYFYQVKTHNGDSASGKIILK